MSCVHYRHLPQRASAPEPCSGCSGVKKPSWEVLTPQQFPVSFPSHPFLPFSFFHPSLTPSLPPISCSATSADAYGVGCRRFPTQSKFPPHCTPLCSHILGACTEASSQRRTRSRKRRCRTKKGAGERRNIETAYPSSFLRRYNRLMHPSVSRKFLVSCRRRPTSLTSPEGMEEEVKYQYTRNH